MIILIEAVALVGSGPSGRYWSVKMGSYPCWHWSTVDSGPSG